MLPEQLTSEDAVRSSTREHKFPAQKPPLEGVVRTGQPPLFLEVEVSGRYGRWSSPETRLLVKSQERLVSANRA